MQETLGVEGLQKAFAQKLADNLSSEQLDLTVENLAKSGADCGQKVLQIMDAEIDQELSQNSLIVAQKQKGLYAVSYSPVGGKVPTDFFKKLYEATADMLCPDEIKVRITPTQGMYIINLTAAEAKKILALTADGAQNAF